MILGMQAKTNLSFIFLPHTIYISIRFARSKNNIMQIMWLSENNIMQILLFLQIFLRIFGRDRRKNQLTDKELHKLNRKELLELMLDQSRQLDDLREQLRQAQEQLASRQLLLNKAGSIAEASLQLNRVFEAAQAAAEQYLENVQTLSGRQTEVCQQLVDESQQKADTLLNETQTRCQIMEAETQARCQAMEAETQEKCRILETETREKCETMTRKAEEQANQAWQQAQEKIHQVIDQHDALKDLLNIISKEATEA